VANGDPRACNLGNRPHILVIAVGSLFFQFVFQPNLKRGTCTVGRCCLRGMASSAFAAVCETYKMTRRFMLLALCLAMASAAFGQNVRRASAETPGPRPIARTEGRKILATIPTVDAESESETDCSHLVHDVYQQAGFPYDYVSSRELYVGSTNFTRVRAPQAGDLVVWRGHVGIVIDPKEHSFFSFVRSGPDTQFYDSPYWQSRGMARFFRYITEKRLPSGRTTEAMRQAEQQPLQGASSSSENRPPSRLEKPAPASASNSAPDAKTYRSATVETPREIVLEVAGKNPSPDEIAAAFVRMNQDSGESLRTRGLNSPGKPVIVYREVRVSAIQITGKRGTALVRIESLGAPNTQRDSPLSWTEQSLEFVKTKRGWVIGPIQGAAYVKREVALQVLSARLAKLAQNTDTTPEQEREQKQIIRFLNLLVTNDSSTAAAQSN
jgi:cell wall-associated NlpC family hydrolase